MASITIKNIGPLSDTGTVELGRFNLFIGKQSTGKSTLMKILCFCQWIEKKIMTGDEKNLVSAYTHYFRFLRELKQFHRLSDNFFKT
ncbi:MAG: AAA family ATPase, partial [Alistipes senegalensis]|uniref:AAA family ATPase n=1 Tax=Alistipes senegalensis TaxID=1288121 RepID=UPI00242FC3B1